MNCKLLSIILLVTSYWLLITIVPVQAAGILPDCVDTGDCQLSDFLQLFVNIANLMLGVLGSVALLFFVIGGTCWLLAAGNQTMIDRGKKTLSGAVIGIIIVLGAWTLVNFAILALTGGEGLKGEFKTKWWEIDRTTTPPPVTIIKKERGETCSAARECKSNTCWQHFSIPRFEEDGKIYYGVCVELSSREKGEFCIPLYGKESECKGVLKCRDNLKLPKNDCDTKIECGGCG